ncbi:ferroxidase fet3 [Coemansia sp. RSA 1807]|nr:ferroxidase fet3 [Coemansia sp. RSA 921]KAJ2134241.1 ferroxidase fet3 [Coemansia sp. RSA 788]KAJ2152063.1 ferroxidase fet3 [Coemansia sp. RSA 637]KAJ2170720.1 ferroxidase fet3 [Coemansia sp. RSA 560]KAJ2200608.1 ferroxidase fet3 [Coemansia sp. RSA 521]KAJ2280455.1 ferroxidase fet3 [Coemansia sp. RSA 451]KAJ2420581.1 ferroxidase fet3 [Coemansia sp. RSA 2524]KAJ2533420.1 ferroxidase fet3 [Coemansia sp. RSA 1935]KAJ2533647.1 ferroxidase fet3 [Coemansia sp. RSA 1937]KAJ2577958.1 ferroxidase
MRFGLAVQLLVFGVSVLAARVQVTWDVGYKSISRDGFSTWRAIGANGQVPIPPIYVTQGDVLELTAINHLDKPITLHAHGLFQRNSTFYDGVGMVTECGIPPGGQYTYMIDTGEQHGLYFIHGHYGLEMSEGLRAPFIIQEKEQSTEYDEDILLTLEDWGQQPEGELIERLKQVSTDSLPNDYKTGLVNGINGNISQTVQFECNRRYRIRVLNIGLDQSFKVQIPGHTMHVIEADGVTTKPLRVDGLDLAPGQRYSVIVQALESDEFNYGLNVTMYADFLDPVPGLTPRYYPQVIEYRKGASMREYAQQSDDALVWPDDFTLEPRDECEMGSADRVIELNKRNYLPGMGLPYYGLGNASYASVRVPTMLSALTMGDLARDPLVYGPQSSVIVLNYMENVELVVRNGMNRSHPMHVHSRVFQVVERGPWGDAQAMGKRVVPLQVARPNNPMRRDTVVLPEFGYIKLRFKADLPGAVSIVHCHTEHLAQGMAVVLVEAPRVLQQNARVPQALLDNCRALGFPISGNGAGNQGYDLTGLPPAIAL